MARTFYTMEPLAHYGTYALRWYADQEVPSGVLTGVEGPLLAEDVTAIEAKPAILSEISYEADDDRIAWADDEAQGILFATYPPDAKDPEPMPEPTPPNAPLAALVQRRLADLDMTKAALADRIERTHTYASQLAAGTRTPLNEEMIAALAEALEVSPDEVYHAAGVIPHDIARVILALSADDLSVLRFWLETRG